MTDTATYPDTGTTDVAPRIAIWSFVAALAMIGVAASYTLWRDRGWISPSDVAVFELELMRIPEQWPLVGAYSRYGWSHPGPLQYYLMWGPWRLFGGASIGLSFGMLLLHLSALIVAWFAARFRSAAAAVLGAGALLLVWAVVGESETLLAWNPLVGLLFGGTALIAAWNASVRGRLGALLLLPIGSLLVQAHVSITPVVIAMCLAAVLLGIWSKGQSDPIPWRWWAVGGVVAAVAWIPPLIDQLWGGGNLQQILSAATAAGPAIGLRQGATFVLDAFAIPPYWWDPAIALMPSDVAPPWLLILPVLALAVALLKRDATQLRFLAIAGTSLVVATISVSRFLDPFAYLGAWIPGIVMVVVAMSVWILCAAADAERFVLLASPLLLLLPAGGVAATLVTDPPPLDRISTITRTGADAIVSEELSDPGVHLDTGFFELLPALYAELERRGVPVSATLPPDAPTHLRALLQSEPADRTPVQIREIQDPEEPAPDNWRVIARGDPFTSDEWEHIRELRQAAADESLTDDQRELSAWVLGEYLDGRFAWEMLVPAD